MWTPKGKSGEPGEINARGELFTFANRRPEEAALNDAGRMFIANIARTPTGATDVFANLTNTAQRDVHVFKIYITAAAAETITVLLGANKTLAGSTALVLPGTTFGPLNGSKNYNPSVTFGTGVDITGFDADALSVDTFKINAANQEILRKYDERIIVGPSQMLFLQATTGAIAVTGYVVFGYPFTLKETVS